MTIACKVQRSTRAGGAPGRAGDGVTGAVVAGVVGGSVCGCHCCPDGGCPEGVVGGRPDVGVLAPPDNALFTALLFAWLAVLFAWLAASVACFASARNFGSFGFCASSACTLVAVSVVFAAVAEATVLFATLGGATTLFVTELLDWA